MLCIENILKENFSHLQEVCGVWFFIKTSSRINNIGLNKWKKICIFSLQSKWLENKEEGQFHDFLIIIIYILHELNRYFH